MWYRGWSAGILVVAVIALLTLSMMVPVKAAGPSNAASPLSPALYGSAGSPSPAKVSPHPGTLAVYEDTLGGSASTVDPAVAYDSISAEPVYNVYQTLVQYNGSSTSSFLPVLSLCVPGPNCAAMYAGNSLIVKDKITGVPEYFTFPIDPAARFYDPATGSNWPVYPSDVVFSMARTCGWADLPGVGATPGWIECQALLSTGDASWDSGIHSPYNNTAQNVLSSMLVNNTRYCPSAALAENGCITFKADGGGSAWPFLLELVADPEGASVVPCGWFTAQSAGVPGFAGTTATAGDGPCFLPGGAKSTSDTSFKVWLKSIPLTFWDSFEMLGLNYPTPQPGVQANMVGSGPYYLANQPFQLSVGYTLEQNPAYHQPTGCTGVDCEPQAGSSHYASKVLVFYEANDTVGIKSYRAGQADMATIASNHTGTVVRLQSEGKIGVLTVPTLTEWFMPFAMEFNVAAAKALDPHPLNVPGDFFNYVGLREFLVNAFPYSTVENQVLTTDGIHYGSNYGGAIPRHMGDYYPTNISWPSGNPVTDPSVVGSAAWWWAQATTPSSPYYDPELAGCTTSSPCHFPVISEANVTTQYRMIHDYLPYIRALTGGRLAPNTFDVPFTTLITGSIIALPGESSIPFFNLGWVPDYPDPTDYVGPMYYPNSTYTSGDAVEQGLSLFTCADDNGGPAAWASMAGLIYWANQPGIPQACQGNAYAAMEWGMMNGAAMMPLGPARVLMYNLVEHIANHLALYVYDDQANNVVTYASWISPTGVNANPMVGGSGDQPWYLWS
jgi:hypothetical protein